MPRSAAHHDLVRPSRKAHRLVTRKALPKRRIGIEFRAVLIEDRKLDIRAQLDSAFIRFGAARKQFDHCGLSNTIGTH